MEKGFKPKIGKSLEGDIAIPEFKETKKDKSPEIDTGTERESPPHFTNGGWVEVMQKYRKELPEDIILLLKRGAKKGGFRKHLSSDEYKKFFSFRDEWWLTTFGVPHVEWSKQWTEWDGQRRQENKVILSPTKLSKAEELKNLKIDQMERLHRALKNLDEGEPVNEFRDETRRVVYYNEEKNQYFVTENGLDKKIGVGDILSDYDWGVKYVPDGEMTEPAYRFIAKRILVNEARRNLENTYNQELAGYGITTFQSLNKMEQNWTKGVGKTSIQGFLGEKMAREYLSRLSTNANLDFIIMRSNAMEDSLYKYDFKIRTVNRDRGVVVESKTPKEKIKRIGIQFKTKLTSSNISSRKRRELREAKRKFHKEMPVDDVILIKIVTEEFGQVFDKWLSMNKPSGGPEQFLSRNLKVEILKAVTKDLVEISDDEIEKIFPV